MDCRVCCSFVPRCMQARLEKVAFATKRFSEKYTIICHENALLFMTTNDMPKPIVGLSASPLLRRETRLLRPPPSPVEYLVSAGDYGRVSGFRRGLGLDARTNLAGVKNDLLGNLEKGS